MADAVPFTLITPRAVKFDGEAELVIAVGTEGEVGILPKHAPYLTALRPGVLRANVREGGATRRLELACSEGFLQALPDKVTILADAALDQDEVDISEARADLAAAQEEQRAAGGDLGAWRRAQTKIDFANARLAVAHVTA
ncbi:MAG TPA: ATP synthase F1 subunit epsilon [Candidatus Elarobacter sp.]|jgi:F-type H+-transporting ATPase subunit epsilon|nr:ATP synthase F1 subunit epsilon [Candidatus Elarobacter sp.]